MRSLAAKRRLGPWIVAVYFMAQVFGVVPLMSGHTADVVGTHSAFCEQTTDGAAIPQSHHQTGDADRSVQHHALQDLNGILAALAVRDDSALGPVVMPACASNGLVKADPVLLERPPKARLSV